MSLIIASASKDDICLTADTLLTRDLVLKDYDSFIAGQDHALKVHIIDKDVAVAIAGHFNVCLDCIVKFKETRTSNANTFEHFNTIFKDAISKNSDVNLEDCEFLIVDRNAESPLAKLDSKGLQTCSKAYIGDPSEYKALMSLRETYQYPKFQSIQQKDGSFKRVPYQPTEIDKDAREYDEAMRKLVHQRRSSTVGAISGLITRVRVGSISKQLEYLQEVEVSSSSAEPNGGYTLLASNQEPYGVGIYYRSGNLGLIFKSSSSDYCLKVESESLKEFQSFAKTTHGMNLTGGTWNTQTKYSLL